MNDSTIKIDARAFICEEGTFEDNCNPLASRKELTLLVNSSRTILTINIDNKQAYAIDSDIAFQIMQLINPSI